MTVRDRIEYAAYLVLAFLVPLLPRRAMVWLGRRLGGLYFIFDRRGRAVGRENLARVFPERTDRDAILRESLRLQGVALLDILWARRLTSDNAHKYLDIRPGHNEFADIIQAGTKGAVCATAHYGSWEMLLSGGGLHGLPRTTFIAREIRNPLIDKRMTRLREQTGNRLVYREGAIIACMSALKKGETVCAVIDMTIRPEQGAVYADFFGTPALTTTAMAMLAVRRKAPLYFVATRPVEKGYRYEFVWEEIEVDRTAERGAETVRLTGELNRALERIIRKHPEPWIWTYKRWKARPTEIPGDYPSYALWWWPT
ncbi:MAG: lysophospholipid acyltransferase family protein [Planctomycetota bacterium]|jgi:KDO2-lipid IV(A) lauroyltransferase